MNLSFDLWNTLIKGNPEFKKVKNDLIRSLSNSTFIKELSDGQIETFIKEIKKQHDGIIEVYGTQPDGIHLFAQMANIFSIPSIRLDNFYNEYQELFLKYPPLLYSDDTEEILKRLVDDGHTLYVSSNTLFTDSAAMRQFLYAGVLGDLISKSKFSGEEFISKPNGEMFFNDTDYHIGDNIKTDGACINFDIKFFQINTNNKTIVDFYNHIKQYEKVLIA